MGLIGAAQRVFDSLFDARNCLETTNGNGVTKNLRILFVELKWPQA